MTARAQAACLRAPRIERSPSQRLSLLDPALLSHVKPGAPDAGARFPVTPGWASRTQRFFHCGVAGIGAVTQEVRATGTVLLPCAPASVAVARQRLTADLAAAGILHAAVRDAALVVSELLSNAIRHAQPLPGANLQVAWAVDDGAVEVAVSDGGSHTRPRQTHGSLSSLGGRGLDIVEYLSRKWGVRTDDFGLTVWAVLSAPGDQREEEPASAATR